MGKFIISTRKNGEFQFNLKATNGQVILSSEGYSSKAGCQNGIESVRKNAQDDSKFERLTAKDGRSYFNLKATNGQIIGSSQMYESDNGMEKGIESVKNNAPNASVEEELD
ncbi:YegP family protein [Chryseobacterium sp. PS-8]|uniref:YegP family protein n=1 Tax=Chryseobacterium indicum TaxID=2766954 RepID=A0ABS9C4F1_9FLAO|nr:YegP family protein [Chryseobacterium sp. PS-8]MCF2219180.1 YegP family protein [Chryseobacterium sp. PS-8]